MPRGIKAEQKEGALTAPPQTDDLVKLGKRQAWANFLAYEVPANCLQPAFVASCAALLCCVWRPGALGLPLV